MAERLAEQPEQMVQALAQHELGLSEHRFPNHRKSATPARSLRAAASVPRSALWSRLDSREKMIGSLRKLISVLVLIVILKGAAFGPLAFGAAPSSSITQAEAESFVRSFYHALEGDDFDKVIAHFDKTVVYYSFGAKDRDYVATDLGQYCASYPTRSFTVDEIKVTPSPNSGGVSVKFDIRFFIRNPEKDITRYGRAHVDWDLAKRDGALKIIRFDGSAEKEPAASPSR